ncbi:MAG TPA: hypothetical protein VFC51_13590 [Chloroflexota bacterium]|nr:hypothetical protein [Chloroflexota bacterium]
MIPTTGPLSERRTLALLAMSGVVSTAVAAVGLLSVGTILDIPRSIRATEPITVLYGFAGGHFAVLVLLITLSACFLSSLWIASRLVTRFSAAVTWAIAIPLAAVFVLAYPTGSTDLFHNVADGHTLWAYREWPDVIPPSQHSDSVNNLVTEWRTTTTKYGPIAYAVAAFPAALGGDDPTRSLIAYKAFGACALVAVSAMVGWAVWRTDSRRCSQSIVMVGWNPLLLYEAATNGHNDVVMAAFAMTSLLFARHHATVLSVSMLALSIAVKFMTGLVAPIIWAWLFLVGSPRHRLVLITLAVAGIIGAALLFPTFKERILAPPGPAAGQGLVASPTSVLAYAIEPWLGVDGIQIARRLCFLVFAAVVFRTVTSLDHSWSSLLRASFILLLALPLLTATQVYPWYLLWSVPISGLLLGSVFADIGIAASIAGFISYAVWPWLPIDAINGIDRPNPLANALYVSAFFGIPFAYVVLAQRLRLPSTQERDPFRATAALNGS